MYADSSTISPKSGVASLASEVLQRIAALYAIAAKIRGRSPETRRRRG
jgi:hypothetical protein